MWVVTPFTLQYLHSYGGLRLDHQASLISSLCVLAVVLAIIVPARRVLLRTSINRLLTTGAVIAVLSADHHIPDGRAFASDIRRAARAADAAGVLVTLGVEPTRPETGYG